MINCNIGMNTNDFNMTKGLEELINKGISDGSVCSPEDTAEYLAENGVIAFPVKLGQTVYAAIPAVFTDEQSVIYSWEVKGVGIDESGRYIAFNSYGEHYVVGGESCRLTKAEAEEDLRIFEMEYNKVDRAEVIYAEN